MMKSWKSGYLTVYAALSLTILVSLFLALFESVRFHTIQLESDMILDVAADSVLAEYHKEMLKQYDMFWIDTSYGSGQPSVDVLEEHLAGYLKKNCNMQEVFLGDYLYRDFLAMEVKEAVVDKIAVASDDEGSFFRSRAIEIVKDDIGISFLERIMEWLDVIEENRLDERDLEQETQEVEQGITQYNGEQRKVGEEWVVVEAENPAKVIQELKGQGILKLVLEDTEQISKMSIDAGTLISSREEQGQINCGNWEAAEEQGLMERLIWQEYLLRYCGYYGSELNKGALEYQVEYLIAGKHSDQENLKSVVNRIMAVREAANLMYLWSDEIKCAEAEAVALILSSAMMIPEAEPLFRAAILLGWAYAESIYDVSCLLEGERIPLLKDADSWHYGINCVFEGLQDTEAEEENGGSGLSYGDYLRLLLALSPLKDQTFRMMDIVEMDIRQTPGNAGFRMDGCVDRLETAVTIHSKYGYSVNLRKEKQY